jgi:hypothetical protein
MFWREDRIGLVRGQNIHHEVAIENANARTRRGLEINDLHKFILFLKKQLTRSCPSW